MNALLDLCRDALWLAVTLGLPLLGVGLLAGLLAGWFSQLTGLSDPAVGITVRATAIVLALWWAGPTLAQRVTALTADAWSHLAALGRAGIPSPPAPHGEP